jgi:DNA-binding MarR family transcriptional regulator
MSSETDFPPPYIGFSMRVVWNWVWELNMQAATTAGYDDVTSAHVSLFRYPGLDGHRLTDIAQRMQITKQSVHELIGHLERCGYLVREPDPTNRRARLVRLTPRGRGLQEVIRVQARDCERRIAQILGDRRFVQLKQALAILVAEIDGDDHDVPSPADPTDRH